jgi:Ca2+-binding RTX toxin-like protein
MAIDKPLLSRTSGQTTSGIADRVVGLSNNTLTLSPTDNQTADNASGKSQPPQGFDGPVPDALTGKIPERATAGSVTSSNDDRQAAVNDKLGLVDQASAIDALLGRGGDQSNGNDDRRSDLLSSFGPGQTDGMPGVDQGFGPSPDGAALAASAAVSGNPMKAFDAASVVGPLGAAANISQSQSPLGIASQGKGVISAGANDPLSKAIEEVKAEQETKQKAEQEQAKVEYPMTSAQPAKISPDGEVSANKELSDRAIQAVKDFLSWFGFNPSSEEVNEGVMNAVGLTRTREEMLKPDAGGQTEEQYNKDRFLNLAQTSTILEQLQAAQAGKPTSQGGSGDVTPADDGGLGVVVRDGSIAQNQSSVDGRNLLGQPVGPAGEQNISGGNKGLDVFSGSNGAGVINPGQDGASPQGDVRFADDPASAAGGRQTSPNLGGGREATRQDVSNSGQAEDLLLTGTNRADTLRGLSGNDTLRGLAGHDILDGSAGRDELTGGAGADRFRFSAGSGFGQANADRITDFNRAQGDRIEISRQAFGLAAGTSVSFQSVNSTEALNQALATGNLFVHDQRNGSLLFNQNGTAAGFGNGGVFASLGAGTALQASDLALIA